MWAIVALKIIAAGQPAITVPFVFGPAELFPNEKICIETAQPFAKEAASVGVGLACKFYPVFTSKEQESF